MPSTHLSLHYHLLFSTKNQSPIIVKEWRANLHAYLGGIVKGIDGLPLAVGGVEDHAHLLVGLRATHRLDYVLRDIKSNSSNWVHREVGQTHFEWQPGYLGLTVSPSQIERVKNTFSIRRSITAEKLLRRSIWNYCGCLGSNTTNVVCGNSVALPGLNCLSRLRRS
jgi:REP element-mobilizing transposase RayT